MVLTFTYNSQILIFIKREFNIQVLRFLIIFLSALKKFSDNLKTFKSTWKHFLYMNYFYSLAEYYNNNSMIVIWCKIFKPVLKYNLLLHYFALHTLSTKGVHIIKYWPTQYLAVFWSVLCSVIFLQLYKQHLSYCIMLPFIDVMTCSTSLY